MTSLLIQHAALIVSMDDADTTWTDGAIAVEDNVILSRPGTAHEGKQQQNEKSRSHAVLL